MNDRELSERVRQLLEAGNAKGASSLAIEVLGPAILGLLCRLHGEDDAEDVYSEFCVGLWRALPRFRWECSLRAYAFRIARYASLHFRRDPWQARRQRLRSSAASRLAISVAKASLGSQGDDRLKLLLAEFDEQERELMAYRIQRELTWDEVALVLSSGAEKVTAAALRKRYQRLTERLQELASAKGLL